jgi:hypothetical protein
MKEGCTGGSQPGNLRHSQFTVDLQPDAVELMIANYEPKSRRLHNTPLKHHGFFVQICFRDAFLKASKESEAVQNKICIRSGTVLRNRRQRHSDASWPLGFIPCVTCSVSLGGFCATLEQPRDRRDYQSETHKNLGNDPREL